MSHDEEDLESGFKMDMDDDMDEPLEEVPMDDMDDDEDPENRFH